MKKFPVISKRGNEYRVDVKECRLFVDHYEVYVYERYIGWFKRERFRFLNESFMGYPRSYNANDFDFDFIAMAKHEVERMENSWEAYEKREQLKIEAERKFEEWDGDCSE